MMAKPHINVSFLSYSHPHRLYHRMPCTSSSLSYMHHIHRFLISPSVPASPCTCFFLSFSITVLMKSTKIQSPPHTLTHHSISSTISHHLLCLHVKLPLNIPIISSLSKFHPNLSYPIYIPSEAHQPLC